MDTAALKTTGEIAGSGTGPYGVRHVGIIMDGNGRWAQKRGLPRLFGHRSGVEALRGVVRHAYKLGIPYLTIYSFSAENWSRPVAEVTELLGLLKHFIHKDIVELHAQNVRVRILGAREGLSSDIAALLVDAEKQTASNTGMTLQIAFNYGARQEIAAAAKQLCTEVAEGRLAVDDVTPAMLEQRLSTAGVPDPDLIIRTSGEQRLSNFLLWQAAYAELVFSPVLWPDFDAGALDAALAEYAGRSRRFGGI